MIDLDDLKKRAESAVGFVDVYLAPDVVLELIDEIKALRDEVASDNKIIAERDRLVASIPQCPVHGQCIPYAIEWVEKSILLMQELKAENDALRRGMIGDYDLDAWLEFSTGRIQKDADRYRWIRRHEFDIGSYHGAQEHNHQAWFEHISDESIDQYIAEEQKFAEDAGHGHVFPRSDGIRMRCGGPNMCKVCHEDRMRKNGETPFRGDPPQ